MEGSFDAAGIMSAVSENVKKHMNVKDMYLSEKDGLYHCGVCHEPLQCVIRPGGREMTVWACCSCRITERDAVEAGLRRMAGERRKKAAFGGNEKYLSSTFDTDDSPGSKLSRIARAYARKFSLSSDWLMLCGGNGIGKSFYAAAICNDISDRGFSFRFITVSELARELWGASDKSEVYRALDRCDLLVVDDLGEARDTEYMNEITFALLDGRLKTGKPCVITTNISPEEQMSAGTSDLRRIYSRVAERSMPVKCSGEDRRKKNMVASGMERINRLLEE